jgi:hypothetical protein
LSFSALSSSASFRLQPEVGELAVPVALEPRPAGGVVDGPGARGRVGWVDPVVADEEVPGEGQLLVLGGKCVQPSSTAFTSTSARVRINDAWTKMGSGPPPWSRSQRDATQPSCGDVGAGTGRRHGDQDHHTPEGKSGTTDGAPAGVPVALGGTRVARSASREAGLRSAPCGHAHAMVSKQSQPRPSPHSTASGIHALVGQLS